MAKNFLNLAKVSYQEVLATDNIEVTKQLNINQAPTLVVVKNQKVELVENVSNIRRYIETNLG